MYLHSGHRGIIDEGNQKCRINIWRLGEDQVKFFCRPGIRTVRHRNPQNSLLKRGIYFEFNFSLHRFTLPDHQIEVIYWS
jgi:hypothetical protein